MYTQQTRTKVLIWTEGKTDWKHLKRASQVLNVPFAIQFAEFEESMGGEALLKKCESHAEIYHPELTIFIFDRDVPSIVSRITDLNKDYKDWGNRVFSIALPIPNHRNQEDNLCIELMYTDQELSMVDSNGRRLFFTSEFKEVSGKLKSNPLISVGNKLKLNRRSRLIDQEVYNENDQNIALSKADFAESIINGTPPFNNVSFEPFLPLFNIIQEIIQKSEEKVNIFTGGMDYFFKRTIEVPFSSSTVKTLYDDLIKSMKLMSLIFIALSIKSYELTLDNRKPNTKDKIEPIKKVISEGFREPSLIALQKLTRLCYYLPIEYYSEEIDHIKSSFFEQITLSSIGKVLDYLEILFPSTSKNVKVLNKSRLKKRYLDYIMPEFARYETKIDTLTEDDINSSGIIGQEIIAAFHDSIRQILELFQPITNSTFVTRNIERTDTNSDMFIVRVSTYNEERVTYAEEELRFEDLRSDQYETCEILLSSANGPAYIELFPFIVIRNQKIYSYRKTRANGYELNTLFSNNGTMIMTKRKFNHFVFRSNKSGDDQLAFWTEVIPTINRTNNVRANIPAESNPDFVGRERQIADVMESVVQIPNQNGLVFGPGGVGKTALMIQVTRSLFNEPDKNKVLFDNIIWVSAKKDYYNSALDIIENREQLFKTLDNVFSVIFEFLGYQDMDEYNYEERKEFMLEVLKEHKVLLILDNFETVSKVEKEAILEFFDTEVKKVLRDKPHYFKVIVTSREQIPSGFRQMSLKGLGIRDSKKLMKKLFEPYSNAREQLTTLQQEDVYKISSGIPIIIKHCYGQVFEYNRPVDAVLRGLSSAGNRVVEFSFAEIFQLIKENLSQLRVLILLELINCSLLPRQISDILEMRENDVDSIITILSNFQCVSRISYGREEKYEVNEDMRIFTRRISQEYTEEAKYIRELIARNYTIDKSMSYTTEEFNAIVIFNDYISANNLLLAEDFLKKELANNKYSVFLNYHYAKFLKERKNDLATAIDLLENVRLKSNNHQQIIQVLMTYLSSKDDPDFNQANIYAIELKNAKDENVLSDVAEFYVKWSTFIKMRTELDPIREMLRQQEYKEKADIAIDILKKIDGKEHKYYYLLAQCYYNKWEYDIAINYINSAIAMLPEDSYQLGPYTFFKNDITKKKRRFNQGQHRDY
jgi:hypothetical protein